MCGTLGRLACPEIAVVCWLLVLAVQSCLVLYHLFNAQFDCGYRQVSSFTDSIWFRGRLCSGPRHGLCCLWANPSWCLQGVWSMSGCSSAVLFRVQGSFTLPLVPALTASSASQPQVLHSH